MSQNEKQTQGDDFEQRLSTLEEENQQLRQKLTEVQNQGWSSMTRRGALGLLGGSALLGAAGSVSAQDEGNGSPPFAEKDHDHSDDYLGEDNPVDQISANTISTSQFNNVEWVDPGDGAAGINDALGPETVVRLKSGTYNCSEQIRIDGYSNCILAGVGGSTILKDETNSDDPLIYWGNAKGGGIRNLAVDGNRDNSGGGSAMFFDNHAAFLDLSNLFIGMCANHGIHINGGYNFSINRVRIGLDYHPTISRGDYGTRGGDTLGDGVHINATDETHPSRCELNSVEAYFCDGHGFFIDHADNIDLFGCEANYCTKDGVRMQGVYGSTIHGLDTEFLRTGLVVGESQHLEDVTDNGESQGISLYGGKNYQNDTAIEINAVHSMAVIGYRNAWSTPTAITTDSSVSNVVLIANNWVMQETNLSEGVTEI